MLIVAYNHYYYAIHHDQFIPYLCMQEGASKSVHSGSRGGGGGGGGGRGYPLSASIMHARQ